jgi:AraC-like DNA-binding protein
VSQFFDFHLCFSDMSTRTQEKNIPVSHSKILLDMLSEHGFHASAILRGTGVELSAVADPQYRLSVDQQSAIYANVLRVSKLDGLGLLHGQRIIPAQLGFFGYAMQTSNSLKQVLKLLIRFSPTIGALMDFQLQAKADVMILTASNFATTGEVRRFTIEEHLSSLDCILKMITGDRFQATRIRFDYPKPAYHAMYTDVFRCAIEFDAPATEYHFATDTLALDLVFADPVMARACEKKCEEIIKRMSRAVSYVDQIRRVILMLPPESRNLTSVAREMNTTARSLRRKLAADQTSFQVLLDDVRLQLAMEYLQSSKLNLEDIAPLVGFSDAANFRHAFKRWTGKTPSSFRDQQAGSSPQDR